MESKKFLLPGQDRTGEVGQCGIVVPAPPGCASLRKNLIAGRVRALNPVANLLEVDGLRIPMQSVEFLPRGGCPK